MQIVIKIPKEFEEHFKSDRFEDSLQRVRFDIHKSIIGNKNVLSGNYEIETLDMLTEAFLNGTALPKGHGRLIDADALEYTCNSDECGMLTGCNHCQYNIITEDEIDNASTIIEADKESEE